MKGRVQFGFDGPRRMMRVQREEASVDDILESLGRRARLSNRLDPIETIQIGEGIREGFMTPALPGQIITDYQGRRSVGKYGFSLMLIGGLVVLGLYGALRAVTDPSSVLRTVLSPTFTSVFGDPLKLGLAGLVCLLPVLIIRWGRNRIAWPSTPTAE